MTRPKARKEEETCKFGANLRRFNCPPQNYSPAATYWTWLSHNTHVYNVCTHPTLLPLPSVVKYDPAAASALLRRDVVQSSQAGLYLSPPPVRQKCE